MRRGFGRRSRRGKSEDGRSAIDPAVLEQVVAAGVVPVSSLEAVTLEGVPESFARLGRGEADDGTAWWVAVSPRSGGDALLAALVATQGAVPAEPSDAEAAAPAVPRLQAAAVAPFWSAVDRRRHAALGDLPVAVRALPAPGLAGAEDLLALAARPEHHPLPPAQVGAHLRRAGCRALFARALAALEGLAAKHGGAVRAVGRSVELVILARRVAALRAEEEGVVLDLILPASAPQQLAPEGLSDALDRLEGNIRKRLNDRKIRDGEEGLRGRLLAPLAETAGLDFWRAWPLGGAELDVIDLVGVDGEGRPVVGAVRAGLDLPRLAEILDAALALEPALPWLLADAPAPVRVAPPRLLLAGDELPGATQRVLDHLTLEALWVPLDRGVLTGAGAHSLGGARRRPAVEAESERDRERGEAGGRRRRGRRRGSRRDGERPPRREAASEAPQAAEGEEDEVAPAEESPGFEEISLFDLDDDAARDDGESSRGRRGRRRRGRRRSRSEGDEGESAEVASEPEAGSEERGRRRRGRRSRRGGDDARRSDEGEEDEALVELSPEPPEAEPDVEATYDQEELEDEPFSEGDRLRLERERRRLARMAKGPVLPVGGESETQDEEEAAEEPARLPRGRAAILARADRESIHAAILLARDLRHLEGLWLYPQEELMTFFRSVATDLREEAPIFVVGFNATPARDAMQAASLYRGRLVWFDDHEWPPEDVGGMREALGEGMLHLAPGAGGVLPLVLAQCSRRSRFSDKLVDLGTGRFTRHDFERWGSLWWWRIGELVGKTGEHRSDVEPLLAGRPSDLAREAASAAAPPPPEEMAFVAGRDFRLIHFGGYVLVALDVPEPLDLHLTARIARERYGSGLSLARREGEEVFVLGTEDVTGRRAIDVGAMVDHLTSKFEWARALPDADHVARFRIAALADHPERLDEVVAEVAMGRSILGG